MLPSVEPAATPPRLETIPRDECVHLLGTRQVGRLGFLQGADLVILPVNYAVDGEIVVFRTDEGAKLEGAPLSRVAFEVDAIDPATREGWSVLIRGVGEELTPAYRKTYERARSLPIDSWSPGAKQHWVRIVPTHITGRRLTTVGGDTL
jgi:nitroimidazol reductase NimA-like FMN-containing flavoprotein (pyridoxamine 5'-phosphate oxidase superfamily)